MGLGSYQSVAGFSTFVNVFTDDRLPAAVINTAVLTASVVVVISMLLGLCI